MQKTPVKWQESQAKRARMFLQLSKHSCYINNPLWKPECFSISANVSQASGHLKNKTNGKRPISKENIFRFVQLQHETVSLSTAKPSYVCNISFEKSQCTFTSITYTYFLKGLYTDENKKCRNDSDLRIYSVIHAFYFWERSNISRKPAGNYRKRVAREIIIPFL